MFSNNDNAKKSKVGADVKKALSLILNDYLDQGKFKKIEEKYGLRYPETINDFMFDFKITFNDDTVWIVHCTSSFRTDRMYGIEYRSENLKKLDETINQAFLVIPDVLKKKDMDTVKRVSKEIRAGKRFSSLDDVLTFRSFELLVDSKIATLDSSGKRLADRGLKLEERLVRIFENKNNWKCWNSNSNDSIIGDNYDWFFICLKTFGISETEIIKSIRASREIPKLSSGGNPKTDVTVFIETNRDRYNFNISCKTSHAKTVSIHEYSAKDFIKVLNIKDEKVKESILEFQKWGGSKAFLKNSPQLYAIFFENISKYNNELLKWAFFGDGGDGKEIQLADYIFTYRPELDSFSLMNKKDFLSRQLKINLQFNTPFSWTYPSGKKAERIQLKAKVF